MSRKDDSKKPEWEVILPLDWAIKPIVRWLWGRLKKLFTLAFLFLFPQLAYAVEAFCPDGASPNADITFCAGYETTTGCTTGCESACFLNNGYDELNENHSDSICIENDAAVAVEGTRYVSSRGKFGSSGPGYVTKNLPLDNRKLVRYRKYIQFRQRPMYYHNHLSGVGGSGSGGCSVGATIEMGGQSGLYMYSSTSCGGGGFDLHPNQGVNPKFQNNKWYRIESLMKMDTSCTDQNDPHGCNGVYKLWVDGTLVISYTDINWGGAKNSADFLTMDDPRDYYHQRVPEWRPETLTDALVISKSEANMIGAAAGEANIGDGDDGVYYDIQCGIESFHASGSNTYAPESDWAPSPTVSICGHNATGYRTAGAYVTSPHHTGVITDSATGTVYVSRPIAEQSYRGQCSGPCGSGFLMPRINGPASGSEGDGNTNAYRGYVHPTRAVYGYIYLPSASVPNDKIAYTGFVGKDTVTHSNYVAITEDSDFWGIIQKNSDGTPTVTHTTAVPIVRDTWHKFQIMIWDTQKVSLMINDALLLDKQTLPASVSWAFDGSHNSDNGGEVPTLIDYIGTGTVTVYVDDIAAGTMSFWNCDGWTTESCPFTVFSNVGGAIPWIF